MCTGAFQTCGGIAAVNRNLVYALSRLARSRGVGLHVLSLHESDEARPSVLSDGDAFRGYSSDKWRMAPAIASLTARSRFVLFDHVTLALPALPLALSRLGRTVIFAHGSESWSEIRRTSRWSFRAAELTLANSNYTLENMKAVLSDFQGVAVPLGLAPEYELCDVEPTSRRATATRTFQDCSGVPRLLDGGFLLSVGRMVAEERKKGMQELIGAMDRVSEEFPNVQLVLAGDGDDRRRLMELAAATKSSGRILFPGRVDVECLQQLYNECYAFVLPSRQEGFGLVYLEAMNYAKACLGCVNDGGADVIVDGETGLLVGNPPSEEELAFAIARLLRDRDHALQLGLAGRRRLREHFTAEQFQARVSAVLESSVLA